MDGIKLRDSRTKKDIVGTAEIGVSVGFLDLEDTALSAPGATSKFAVAWDHVPPPEDSETELDAAGERVFFDSDWERVVESDIEPYVDDMSERVFFKSKVVIEFVSYSPDVLRSAVHEATASAVNAAMDGRPVFAESSYDPSEELKVINATEMAMWLTRAGMAPGAVCLDGLGREAVAEATVDDPQEQPEDTWRRLVNSGATFSGFAEWMEAQADRATESGDIAEEEGRSDE